MAEAEGHRVCIQEYAQAEGWHWPERNHTETSSHSPRP